MAWNMESTMLFIIRMQVTKIEYGAAVFKVEIIISGFCGWFSSFFCSNLVVLRGLFSHLGLLGKEDGVDIRQNSTGGNGNISKKSVQLFVILDGKSNMTRNDTRLLVVTGSIASQLQDLGTQVLCKRERIESTGSRPGEQCIYGKTKSFSLGDPRRQRT